MELVTEHDIFRGDRLAQRVLVLHGGELFPAQISRYVLHDKVDRFSFSPFSASSHWSVVPFMHPGALRTPRRAAVVIST